MKTVYLIARYLIVLVFLVFGANKFIGFIEFPQFEGAAGDFMGAIWTTGFLKIVGVIEIIAALLLIVPKYAPLGAVIAMPVTINIFLFHAVVEGVFNPVGLVLLILNFLVLLSFKSKYDAMYS